MQRADVCCWSWCEEWVQIMVSGKRHWCKVRREPGGRLYCVHNGDQYHIQYGD